MACKSVAYVSGLRELRKHHLHIYADRSHDISEPESLWVGSTYIVEAAQNIISFRGQLSVFVHLVDGELEPGR